MSEELQPHCGHPMSAVVSSDEGTSYCAMCEAAARVMQVELTPRGFEIIRFKDHYDFDCSLQQSSLAEFEQPGSSAVWFGVGDNRMHLGVELLRQLIPHLQQWLETGSFVLSEEGEPDAND
jgi:hypothetical protein